MSKVSASSILLLCFICSAVSGSVTHGDDHIHFYEIKSGNFSIKVTNFGASIASVKLPNKYGTLTDVVLGYETAAEYKSNNKSNFGAILGRVANRIKNAEFVLNGTRYNLTRNSGNNSAHGGVMGFSRVVWEVAKHKPNGSCPYITFTYNSPDGDQGFPGDVRAKVTYSINDNYHLSINMMAETLNKATPINMAIHTYWNLGGHKSGNISSEQLQLFASKITNVDEDLVPDGNFSAVHNTPYDFLEPVKIGTQLEKLPKPTKLGSMPGFDINYVVDAYEESDKHRKKKVAILYDEKSRIKMELNATAPGVQLFTANSLKDRKGKEGALYQAYAGVCLETQDFPDAVNHKNFPTTIITKDNPYYHSMSISFTTM